GSPGDSGSTAIDSAFLQLTGRETLKRLLLAVLLAALVAVPAAAAKPASPPTLHSGQLVIGLDPPAVGFQVGTLRGDTVLRPTGYEVDLGKAIAAKLGISSSKISWKVIPWETLFRPGAKPSAAFAALQVGRCDAFIMDVPIIASQKKTKPSAYGPVAGQIVTHEQYGAVMAKGSKLTPDVSAAIRALTKDGTIAKLQQKWF